MVVDRGWVGDVIEVGLVVCNNSSRLRRSREAATANQLSAGAERAHTCAEECE
jgi:hypothetical protein